MGGGGSSVADLNCVSSRLSLQTKRKTRCKVSWPKALACSKIREDRLLTEKDCQLS